ncbi:DNA polymerase zeta catalytic subunit [Trichinella spiralis]|uniref:DNA-directed DNA polymerase n=1 Tax=Trichinella spiralis TaxID=6334 RepID=A0A0V1B1K1_TRISP|nr:DNA polymerase zeta catalytic subunit [Trichinella spiralis]
MYFHHCRFTLFDEAVRWVDVDCRRSGAFQMEPDDNVSGLTLQTKTDIYLKPKTFAVGAEIAASITEMNPYPIYYPCILQIKKTLRRLFVSQSVDQMALTFDAKGIETVRRDTCPAVSKV